MTHITDVDNFIELTSKQLSNNNWTNLKNIVLIEGQKLCVLENNFMCSVCEYKDGKIISVRDGTIIKHDDVMLVSELGDKLTFVEIPEHSEDYQCRIKDSGFFNLTISASPHIRRNIREISYETISSGVIFYISIEENAMVNLVDVSEDNAIVTLAFKNDSIIEQAWIDFSNVVEDSDLAVTPPIQCGVEIIFLMQNIVY